MPHEECFEILLGRLLRVERHALREPALAAEEVTAGAEILPRLLEPLANELAPDFLRRLHR